MRSTVVINRKKPEHDACLPPILARLLPPAVKQAIRGLPCRRIEEIHLRVSSCCSATDESGVNHPLDCTWQRHDMDTLVDALCDGSRYALSRGMDEGYLCPGGGVRVGLCGLGGMRTDEGENTFRLQRVDAVCIRLPGHFPCVGAAALPIVRERLPQGVLFYSPPGVGKTTLIRALAKALSSGAGALRCVMVDTRRELDDGSFSSCRSLDILAGYPKAAGIEIAVRTLGAQLILCDELGAAEAQAVLRATMYGVPILATAHAWHPRQLWSRPEMRLMRHGGVFGACVGLVRRGMGEDYDYTLTDLRTCEEQPC